MCAYTKYAWAVAEQIYESGVVWDCTKTVFVWTTPLAFIALLSVPVHVGISLAVGARDLAGSQKRKTAAT